MNQNSGVKPESQAVQAHLNILQAIIQRMATNSASSKAWCIALVSAILVVVANKNVPAYVWISAAPIVLFCFLDVYYLTLEQSFRKSYNDFIDKLHSGKIDSKDLYVIDPHGSLKEHWKSAVMSLSILPFYVVLVFTVALAHAILI